jgi:hypothetical protein
MEARLNDIPSKPAPPDTAAAIEHFRDGLRDAQRLFEENSDGAGRRGVIRAVEATLEHVTELFSITNETLQAPLLATLSALCALDRNKVAPLVSPTSQAGRPTDTALREGLKGAVAYSAKRLRQMGEHERIAYVIIAKELGKLNLDYVRHPITKDTIRGWCESVAADVGRHGIAAQVCDKLDADDLVVPHGASREVIKNAILKPLIELARKTRGLAE